MGDVRSAKAFGRTNKIQRLLDRAPTSLQAIMAWRQLRQIDPDNGQALFVRGLASLMEGARVNSLTPSDLRAIADRLHRET